eukprot:gene20224-26977_t
MSEIWTTCPEDRPLFVQFCANDPAHLIRAAKMVEGECDYIDLNFGCPQHIAKGYYGAFLMDNLPLVEELVTELCKAVSTPVSCKIRIFSDPAKTLSYAKMIERAGCSLLAVHGRTRDQKNTHAIRADWDAIKMVKEPRPNRAQPPPATHRPATNRREQSLRPQTERDEQPAQTNRPATNLRAPPTPPATNRPQTNALHQTPTSQPARHQPPPTTRATNRHRPTGRDQLLHKPALVPTACATNGRYQHARNHSRTNPPSSERLPPTSRHQLPTNDLLTNISATTARHQQPAERRTAQPPNRGTNRQRSISPPPTARPT